MHLFEFGEVPPPYGGVSVHVQRLLARLVNDNIDVTLVSRQPPTGVSGAKYLPWRNWPRLLNHLEFTRFMRRPFGSHLLHLHLNPVFYAPLTWLHVAGGGCALITVHDQMLQDLYADGLFYEKHCFNLLTGSDRVEWIAVSHPIARLLWERGVPRERVRVIPAFIPPVRRERLTALPAALEDFLVSHPFTSVIYGYRRTFRGGRDLYGFDFGIEILKCMIQAEPKAGLILLCPDARQDAAAWEELRGQVQAKGLTDRVLFHLEPIAEPTALWERCSVMLRPSVTDGDSVAVREMLAVGRPVIASDVVPRPVNAVVLPLGDARLWAETALRQRRTAQMGEMNDEERDTYSHVKEVLLSLMREHS